MTDITYRLRAYDDEQLSREADLLMSEAANAIDSRDATIAALRDYVHTDGSVHSLAFSLADLERFGEECRRLGRRMALEEAISTCLLHVDEPGSKEWNLAIKCCLATLRALKDKA